MIFSAQIWWVIFLAVKKITVETTTLKQLPEVVQCCSLQMYIMLIMLVTG